MSSDIAAEVNNFVVLAVKKSVSGVAGSVGKDAMPYCWAAQFHKLGNPFGSLPLRAFDLCL